MEMDVGIMEKAVKYYEISLFLILFEVILGVIFVVLTLLDNKGLYTFSSCLMSGMGIFMGVIIILCIVFALLGVHAEKHK